MRSTSKPGLMRSMLLVSAAAIGGLSAGQAAAQDADEEEIVVTGSYIRGTPKDAALPVDVITQDDLLNPSRNKIAPETIDLLLQAAKQSIGTRQAEEVAHQQLVFVFDCLATLREQIAAINEERDQRVQELHSPLFSLGITANLVAVIHSESDPIHDFRSADQYVAYAGLDPSSHRSGDTINRHGKISKRGSPTLRRALYLAAFVAIRKHACFRHIYQKHRRRGKGHSNALVIVARHLARVVWRLLTDGREFTKRPPHNSLSSPQQRRKSK